MREMPAVLLASASERRRSMMSDFSEIDEIEVLFSILKEPEPEPSAVQEVSLQVESSCMHKARNATSEFVNGENPDLEMIVVSDTLVEDPDDSRIALGKPKDKISAASTLIRLSGRRHKVWSSTAIISRNGSGSEDSRGWRTKVWTDFAIVEFDEIRVEELEELIGSGSWIGKAGGYDLAENASSFSRIIEGSRETVLGFSVRAFNEIKKSLSRQR